MPLKFWPVVMADSTIRLFDVGIFIVELPIQFFHLSSWFALIFQSVSDSMRLDQRKYLDGRKFNIFIDYFSFFLSL